MEELISIIVPVYKVEKYLDRCVISIINQTYSNIEIILVDDGSPDKCGEMCEKWAEKDSRIKVIHKENGGLSDARNCGIDAAKGNYISFIDSDDYVADSFIEKLYSILVLNNSQISCVDYEIAFDDKQISQKKGKNETMQLSARDAIKVLFSSDKFSGFAWNKLYKANLFNEIRFPVGRKMEDMGTLYRLFDKCERIAFYDEVLYYYFQREDSILHSIDNKFIEDKYEMAKARYEYLKMKYPDLTENAVSFADLLLCTYTHLSSQDKIYAKKELDYIFRNNSAKEFTWKIAAKYYLFKYFEKIYFTIFKN